MSRRRVYRSPRRFAALGYLTKGPVREQLISIEDLILVVLYDELTDHTSHAIRLAGFSACRVPWGVVWGGSQQSKFYKDLSIRPKAHGRGTQLDLSKPQLIQAGLQLDQYLENAIGSMPRRRRRRLQLPKLWAAFQAEDAKLITGDGPELDAVCRQMGGSRDSLLNSARRMHRGSVLFPMDWVSHYWEKAVAVLADLRGFPKRQAFRLGKLPGGLQGYRGATQFDFFQTRFVDRASSEHAPNRPRLTTTQLVG